MYGWGDDHFHGYEFEVSPCSYRPLGLEALNRFLRFFFTSCGLRIFQGSWLPFVYAWFQVFLKKNIDKSGICAVPWIVFTTLSFSRCFPTHVLIRRYFRIDIIQTLAVDVFVFSALIIFSIFSKSRNIKNTYVAGSHYTFQPGETFFYYYTL